MLCKYVELQVFLVIDVVLVSLLLALNNFTYFSVLSIEQVRNVARAF